MKKDPAASHHSWKDPVPLTLHKLRASLWTGPLSGGPLQRGLR
jgi:hypothetical protein